MLMHRQPCQCTYFLEEPAVIPDVHDRSSVLPHDAGPKLQPWGFNRHLAGGKLCPQREASRLALAGYQDLQVTECALKHAHGSTDAGSAKLVRSEDAVSPDSCGTGCQCQAQGTQGLHTFMGT